jgi:hypothetical protein
MLRWTCTAAVALGRRRAAPARADDDTARALAALGRTREGRGTRTPGGVEDLVGKGARACCRRSRRFADDNATATNWLRTALDAIVEGEKAAGRKLPGDKLEAFAKDAKHAATARHAAYELLVVQDPDAKARLLPGFLNDKSPDLRREAVGHRLDVIEKDAKARPPRRLEKLFTYARDKDQVEAIAKKVGTVGGKVSVSEHFGFVTRAALVGPFDSTGGKGFAAAYPPEGATDATGAFPGKGGEQVKWTHAETTNKDAAFDLNKLLGKHKDAVAYALATVVADAETPCEVRVTCPTAVRIFLNGQPLFAREEYHHGAAFDAHVGKGTLRKGDNVIVLKVVQNDQKEPWAQVWQFQMRVCDSTGGPLPLKQKVTANGKEQLVTLGYMPVVTEEKERRSDPLPSGFCTHTHTRTHTPWGRLGAVQGAKRVRRVAREGPPTEWSQRQGHAWQAKLPARGVSSPVVAGGRVYVTCSSGTRDDRLHVLCFDAGSGKQLWHRQLQGTGSTAAHPKSSMAANTPVADETGVYALFATGDLAAFDADGTLRWYRSLVGDYPTITNQVGWPRPRCW